MTAFMRGVWLVLCLVTGLARAEAPAPRILVFGDSLSAAYGIPAAQGWAALLQQRLRAQGYPHTVVNASISGETSAGGLARLPAALAQHRPGIVLLELGANDGLRGLPVKQMRGNLGRMLELSRQAGAKSLLFEMRIPANYGAAYGDSFLRTFSELSKASGTPLVPFFLGAIALDPAQFLDDGLHPAASAQPKLLDAIWPTLKPLLQK
ncbi:MAG TPA: arylesterase [Solimonas sp.]|nr:arylesterase [Solimonas sp.]